MGQPFHVTQAEQMIDNIRESFNDLLSEVPWMDEKTREVAREKVAETFPCTLGCFTKSNMIFLIHMDARVPFT